MQSDVYMCEPIAANMKSALSAHLREMCGERGGEEAG